jgi:hypothetical protein
VDVQVFMGSGSVVSQRTRQLQIKAIKKNLKNNNNLFANGI